jgi:formiminotetrahydrofolate cyclodeaminase
MTNGIDEFLDRLASGAPTPGGGSAAAIMGAMGAALVSMVCNVSIGKKACEASEPQLRALLAESEALRRRLTSMVEADIAAFDGLMAAYRLARTSDDDKARRAAAIQTSLRRATEVPLECARACADVVALAARAVDHGYRQVISDAGVAVAAADAALRSAALNVFINAPALDDRHYAEGAVQEVDGLAKSSAVDSTDVYARVRGKLES